MSSQLVVKNKRWLVTEGDRIGKLAGRNPDWNSQIRIIQDAARDETEPAVINNLIRYQAARSTSRRSWNEPREVATELCSVIDACSDRARDDSGAAMDMIRHLLLYTVRAYTHSKGGER